MDVSVGDGGRVTAGVFVNSFVSGLESTPEALIIMIAITPTARTAAIQSNNTILDRPLRVDIKIIFLSLWGIDY
jgi:hypothetical protein